VIDPSSGIAETDGGGKSIAEEETVKRSVPRLVGVVIGMTAFVGITTIPAMAADLTGTWEGTVRCQGFIQGQPKASFSVKDVQFQISQSGRDLNLQVVNPLTLQSNYFDGLVVDDGVHTLKGEAALLECTSGVESIGGAMIRAKVSTDLSGKGRLGGTLFAVDSDPTEELGTCKFTLKRVDTADPSVPGCQ
jgi:hypothetical protein